MGERKVLNKYYPPDFDPEKIPKRIPLKNEQMKVRMMLPMSIRCQTCGTYMYKGTKFNCRKEDVKDDKYLGLMKFRFYFKCTKCSSELIMKTDPKNSDYEMEFGASRNFEPWRAQDEAKAAAKKQREQEEMGDAMKALENRTLDSRMEMDILSALDEMKSMRARQAALDPELVLSALQRTAEPSAEAAGPVSLDLTEEDERLIKTIVFRNSEKFVRRIDDDEEEEEDEDRKGKRAKLSEKGDDKVNELGSTSGNSVPDAKSGGKEKLRDKWAEDRAPVFEVKPVKVGFMVKSKPKGSTTASTAVQPVVGTAAAAKESETRQGTNGGASIPSTGDSAKNGEKQRSATEEAGNGANVDGSTALNGLSAYGSDESE